MGKWKSIIPIALALVIAAVGSFFVYTWLKRQTTGKEKAGKVHTETVPIAVAAADLAWGTKLEKQMVRAVPFPKESLPVGHFSDPASLEGRVLITSLKQNVPIIETGLAPDSVTMGGVSAVVKHGKRAVAVKGDKVIGISGFICPANRVDVLVTLTHPANNKKVAKTVLEDILVLATGTVMEEDSEGGKPHPVDVYTLEVTPEEGEKLAIAATQGKLQFALRNVMDKETVLTEGATIPGALASFRPKPPKRAKSKSFTVEVVKGGKESKVRVKS